MKTNCFHLFIISRAIFQNKKVDFKKKKKETKLTLNNSVA